jgi:AbrB family looped-hinge helix DNA binding protein
MFKNRKILLSYMEITKMSSKGQIVIPQKIRDELKINEGTIVAVEKMKDMIVIKKIDMDLVRQFEEGLEDLKSGRIRRVA